MTTLVRETMDLAPPALSWVSQSTRFLVYVPGCTRRSVGLPWPGLLAYFRLVTNPRVYSPPAVAAARGSISKTG